MYTLFNSCPCVARARVHVIAVLISYLAWGHFEGFFSNGGYVGVL